MQDTPDPDLIVDVVRERGATVVIVRGELDAASTPDLQQRLRAEAGPDSALVLDLLACDFVDSTGLHAIIDARAEIEDAGGRFAIAAAEDGPAARVIEVALPGMLETHPTREAAVDAVTG